MFATPRRIVPALAALTALSVSSSGMVVRDPPGGNWSSPDNAHTELASDLTASHDYTVTNDGPDDIVAYARESDGSVRNPITVPAGQSRDIGINATEDLMVTDSTFFLNKDEEWEGTGDDADSDGASGSYSTV